MWRPRQSGREEEEEEEEEETRGTGGMSRAAAGENLESAIRKRVIETLALVEKGRTKTCDERFVRALPASDAGARDARTSGGRPPVV